MQQKLKIIVMLRIILHKKHSNPYIVTTHKAKLLHILEFDIIFAFKLNF